MLQQPSRRARPAELSSMLWTRWTVLRRRVRLARHEAARLVGSLLARAAAALALLAGHAASAGREVSTQAGLRASRVGRSLVAAGGAVDGTAARAGGAAWRRVQAETRAAFPDPRVATLAAGLLVSVAVLAAGGVAAAVVTDPGAAAAAAGKEARAATPPHLLARDDALGARGPVPSGTSTAGAAAVAVVEPPPAPAPPPRSGVLPFGKGMWIWQPEQVEGGDVDRLVARAVHAGLTHLYVRTGSSKSGFHGGPFLDAVLPKAHDAGLRVYGWDFPYLFDPAEDARRGAQAAAYSTAGGHRLDGFVADVETRGEGVNITPIGAFEYGRMLREAVGHGYPLVVAVPRPNPALRTYPFPEVVAHFDAVAPMVYWLNRQPEEVGPAVEFLSQFGVPVMPIGQAYDGALEGGRPGPPPPDEIQRFLSTAEAAGAAAVSFWSWQHADQGVWDAIAAAPEFTLPAPGADPATLAPAQVRALQVLLRSVGRPGPITGVWTDGDAAALRAYQAAVRLPETGLLDADSLGLLLARG